MAVTIILFFAGAWFGYHYVFPGALRVLIGDFGKRFNAVLTIEDYTNFFLAIVLGLGVTFELPILIFFLALFGIVDAKFLIKHIRYAVLAIFVIAAIICPTPDTAHLPTDHDINLHTRGALTRNRNSLDATLDSFSLAKPAGLGDIITQPGPHLHLYPKGQAWYVPVAQRWFEVTLDENDTVLIIDPKDPNREGPALIGNRLGQWFVDTRLRLRGGGMRSRRQKGQRLRPPKIRELREQLAAFDTQVEQRRQDMMGLQQAIDHAPPADRAEARTTYLTHVSRRLEELDVPIAQLKSLNILDTVPTYQEAMLGYLHDQMILARSATAEQMIRFRDGLHTVSEYLDNEDLPDTPMALEDCRAVDASTQAMVERISYLQSRFKEARALGVKGVELVLRHEQVLPKITLDDLKAFRITLSRFLCVNEAASASKDTARSAIEIGRASCRERV